ncbi:DUF6233 domain-containing protein [Streptomyces sp. NBC_01443]|uniref:DUF6233 domain-containing protein n=1 Tax=Streptomyces sp. NBC_01443 TaxID=2903868 RepID=UPI0022549527|nr:DUF6233 domain-containing protein [Streptomyces sp. NBC_01443]MCX4633491.1 DUF6233 domain-containing protein [Streptomyces sp. NBC_01443]
MSELPPDLLCLRTVVTYLRGELGRAQRALNTAEEREALAAQRQPLPEPPACLVERSIGAGRLPVRVHAGDCWDARNRCTALSTDEARRTLAEGVPACPHCRPDVALGVLE